MAFETWICAVKASPVSPHHTVTTPHTQISGPNLCHRLATLGYEKDSKLYVANGILMAATFFVFRVVLPGSLLIRVCVDLREEFLGIPTLPMVAAGVGFGLGYPLQLFWFSKIAKGIIKIMAGGSGSGRKRQ